MDWKSEAVDKLKQYEAKRQALVSLPLEIAQVESTMTSIRSSRVDGVAVKGSGSSGREDMLLSCIVHKDELRRNLDRTQMWVDNVNAALGVLDQDERKVLDRLYMTGERNAMGNLAEEFFVDVRTIHRWKVSALRKFTIALYGAAES